VLGFLGGRLPPDERATVEEHIAICGACADLLTWAAADQASSTAAPPGLEGRPFVGQLCPGARVARYQILGALGRGGMGEVYAAYHPDLDRRIALKVVAGTGPATGERRARLLREARAIARLSHPNVVAVHDAGIFGDRVFIAMELIEGSTIDAWLRAEHRTWRQIVDVFMAAGRGLAAAHAADVIHRDFKPQNVMVARTGAVRVMDFGLARLTADPTDGAGRAGEDAPTLCLTARTKTGAFIGTPAYMSPEQFRRDPIDARSDEFSFCVALHEALFGARPPSAPRGGGESPAAPSEGARRDAIPSWLRAVVLRGAAVDREKRYGSMDALLAALEQGRTRVRRRVAAVAIACAVLAVGAGAWRVAHANRIACTLPKDRLAEVWPVDARAPRRLSVHHAFMKSGKPTAETSWERVSRVLDEYIAAWGTMYVQACEATHIRGEQSAEVLDLRMSCLNDNLDQVRALTNQLATADANALAHAVGGAYDLTPVRRCADVPLLKSVVPLPKDERTLDAVQRLRKELVDIQWRLDLSDARGALERLTKIRPQVDATGYKPLLGEILYMMASAQTDLEMDATATKATLHSAMAVAEASRDDLTAAKVVAVLVYVTGYFLGQQTEAEFWAALGHAILDRIGGDQTRLRSWIDNNLAGSLARFGDFQAAQKISARSVLQKERILGKEHPDFAMGLSDLAFVLTRAGRPADGLDAATRSIQIHLTYGDPDALGLGRAYANQGEAFSALHRYGEAEQAFLRALENLRRNVGREHSEVGFALHGLGETRLASGAPLEAIDYFEEALRIRRQPLADPTLAAESEFGLARALWDSRRDRKRARALASEAQAIYRKANRPDSQRAIDRWLADHLIRN
jgi:tetratricopeptide (TPR) repeat protein